MRVQPFLCLGGVEVVNGVRTLAYLEDAGISGLVAHRGNCDCAGLFSEETIEDAPWFDSSRPESSEFLGIYATPELPTPLRREVSEIVSGGGVIGPMRPRSRIIPVQGSMYATTARGMAYGERWLQEVLSGQSCTADCVADELELSLSCPEVLVCLDLDGTDDSEASTPDHASFNVGLNVLDLNIKLKETIDGVDQVLASQWDEPNNRGWLFLLRGDGLLNLRASGDGTATTVNAVSTAAVPLREFTSYRARFEPVGPNSLLLDGTGDWASTPNHADLNFTGDLDLRVYDVALDDWTPAANNNLVGKLGAGATTGFAAYIRSAVIPGGSTFQTAVGGVARFWNSSIAFGLTDGATLPGYRVTRVAATGQVTFWTLVAGVWTPFGTAPIAGTAGAQNPSTSPLQVGANGIGGLPLKGRVGRVELRNGIDGTIVANPDFSIQPLGTTSFVDSTGKTWTLAGNASIFPGGWETRFWTRPASSNFWVPLGSIVAGTPGLSVFNSTTPVRIGAAG